MNQNNVIAALVGAIAGAAASYAIMQNKDKILEKFNELEDVIEEKLASKGLTKEKAQEAYNNLSSNVHASMDKISSLLHAKENVDIEYILAELAELKAKVSKLAS